MRARATIGAVTALGLVAVGCGDDVATSEIDLEGLSVTVGSKNFTEQYVLSEILLQALAANGAGVTDAVDTGDTPTTRAALEAGDIDAYFEYNSTGWVEILEQGTPPDSDGEALTEAVRELDADNGIEWLGRSTFNDTYGFAKSPEVAADTRATRYSVEAFDLQAMAEHLEENDDAVVCVEPEFTERADGLVLFEDETGYEVPDSQLRVLEAAEIYEATALDDCDFGEVFTTDGRIEAFDLDLVVDDGVFYVYNVSLNVRSEVYDEHADDLDALVRDILRPMSQRRMIDLNRRVSDGEPVADVAQDYLRRFDIV